MVPVNFDWRETGSHAHTSSLEPLERWPTCMPLNIEKGQIWAVVLGALVLMAPMAKQSKEFMNCVKNAETGIVNLPGVEFLDEDGEGGFIERPVAIHY